MHEPANEPRWSITRAEWEGVGRLSVWLKVMLGISVAVELAFIVTLWLDVFGVMDGSSALMSRRTSLMVAIVATLLAFLVAGLFWRARRTMARLRPLVWESDGCVCPWCRVRVDQTPCARHGLSRADQQQLLDYWEALATQQAKPLFEASQALANASSRHRRRIPVLSSIADAFRQSMAAHSDPDRTGMQRLLGSWRWTAIQLAAFALAVVLAAWLLPRGMFGNIFMGCWPWLLVAPLYAFVGPLRLKGRLRCTACGQYCADQQQQRCHECGADLTAPAAVTRMQAAPVRRYLLLAVPMVAAIALMFATDSLTTLLPTGLRNTVWSYTRPPMGYWSALNPATMTPAEVEDAATPLIRCAEPDGPRPLFDFDFLPKAEAAGKLSAATIESAARATVRATLHIERTDAGLEAVVRPQFGVLLFGQQRTPRLVFGGACVDDGPWTPGAEWSLFLHDIDPFWRTRGTLPPLPESQLEFRAPLGTLAPGTHRVRARCWIVVVQPAWERFTPSFDASGALVPPPGALVFEIPLETTTSAP